MGIATLEAHGQLLEKLAVAEGPWLARPVRDPVGHPTKEGQCNGIPATTGFDREREEDRKCTVLAYYPLTVGQRQYPRQYFYCLFLIFYDNSQKFITLDVVVSPRH